MDSQFYVQRPGDEEFRAALARRETIVRIKGPSQVGKTSLLARGLAEARAAGSRVVVTHLRTFNAAHLENADAFLAALAESIAEQLDVETVPRDFWEPHRGANPNFRRYLRRRVLPAFTEHLVWALDEVDQLFERGFGTEIFGLFRSWHDERALEPEGPWSRLTLAMAYSTESHLLIANIHQSPFNVGTCIELEDFPIGQVEELNRRHGRPLAEPPRLIRFYELLGGHPYLVRRGLQELAAHGTSLETFERRAASDDWIFGDHLRRLRAFLARHAGDAGALEQLLRGERSLEEDTFYRLRSAGILGGQTCEDARFRCRLYETYLKRHL